LKISNSKETIYVARVAQDGREQTTVDHTESVAVQARMFARKFMPKTAYLIGKLHDMGKLSRAFVEYLHDKDAPRGSIIHATQGAQYVYEFCQSKNVVYQWLAEIISICIASHHGHLPDGVSPNGETPLCNKLLRKKDNLYEDEIRGNFKELFSIDMDTYLEQCVAEFHGFLLLAQENKQDCFSVHMLVKLLFSCLVDADCYDAYCFETSKDPEKEPQIPNWDTLIDKLENYLCTFQVSTKIDKIRHRISSMCRTSANCPIGIYRLEVPTGGGKTLSSLRFALHHAKEHSLEHIIYVIPYLSVLDQTAKEIRKALQDNQDDVLENVILEHHSNLVPSEKDEETYKLLTSRWDSPIIITTSVRFLESIYSEKRGELRKVHNMTNAVIVFDEVQALPIKCVSLFNGAVNFFRFFGNTTAVLCTATQPLLDKTEHPIIFSEDAPLLIENMDESFEDLKRTCIVDSTKTQPNGHTVEDLRDFVIDKLSGCRNCLIVLNTKKHASDLYKSMIEYFHETPWNLEPNQVEVVHLSTLMCSAHRLEVIEKLKGVLDQTDSISNKHTICISTQLIEAGVDISFDCVIRELAGLDSIAQAAGRCNRHGEYSETRNVYIVNLENESLKRLSDIKCGADITRDRILTESRFVNNLLSKEAMEKYYSYYFYERRQQMDYPIGIDGYLYDLLSVNQKGTGVAKSKGTSIKPPYLLPAFRTAGEKFSVIDDVQMIDVIVSFGNAQKLIDEYRCAPLHKKLHLLQELGRYTVSLYQFQKEKLLKEALYELNNGDNAILILKEKFYDSKLGVIFEADLDFLCD
jgi:CRISPR-associated endonuclease/helicase Cas3